MKNKLLEIITRHLAPPARFAALLLAAIATTSTWAATAINPVTDETETYTYKFTGGNDGTGTEWNTAENWSPSATPYIYQANAYNAALVDGKIVSTTTTIDGWALGVGAYNSASITWGTLGKIQDNDSTDMWLTVDDSSRITINGWGNGNLGQSGKNLNYYVAAQNGVTWSVNLASGTDQGLTMNYYLAGNGSVSYKTLERCAHVIKMADVTLTGTSGVSSKTLVSFTSTTKTFTADADIKVKNSSGTVLETLSLTSVTSGETTLTGTEDVGTCELVQTSTGIVLYYVDGDPSTIVAKTYQPSININFCFGNAPLTTAADVGYSDYAVPGTSWNNMTSTSPSSGNGTFTTLLSDVYAVKTDGTKSLVSGASVALSGTPGSYKCNSLAAATDLRHGYIDENANNTAPTVTVSGIPYDKYKVVVYTSTDSANSAFGYVSVNGTSYTYVNDELAEGTTSWGASGAADSANAIAEGVNMLVTPTISGGTLTVVGHKMSGGRGCIAAIQIVKVEQELEDGDLLIELEDDETYSFDSAGQYNTVYVTGEGTVTFAGTASTATTLHIGPAAAVNMVGSALTPTVVTGNGTAVYDGAKPTTGLGWTDSANWQGTLWVTNCSSFTQVLPDTVVNANSILRLTDCSGYFNNGDNAQSCDGTLELVDGNSAAFTVSDGYSAYGMTTFAKLIGDGTLTHSKGAVHQRYVFTDPSEFKGTINIPAGTETYGTGNNRPLRVILGDYSQLATSAPSQGSITIAPGATATVASGKTWTAAGGGIAVYGTLNVNGTLAVSSDATSAIKGSGTVVFAGKMPSPTTDAWWKNAAWTGTVQIKSAAFTGVSGVDTYLDVNKYGNDGSVLELNNCSGWLPVGNTSGDNVCAVPLKVTGTLTINDGYSNRKFTINKLLGNGAIYTTNNGATVTIQVLNADGFTGYVQLNSKRVIFGETIPDTFTSGQICVGSGFSFTVPNSNAAWFGTGGITLDGELKAAALSNFGGGTTITTTDNGVFTLVSNSNADDMNVDYTRIQGTGTLKFDGTNYRTISTNNFPTALTVVNNLSQGLIHRNSGIEVSIGSLSGSGQMRSDWGGSGSTGDRDLRILQAKDTTYSGLFASTNDRIDEVYVAPGASTAGTLTLSGTQTASNGLIVETGASVNLTGTWVGATTVSGTFGGTGTLTGAATFSDNATFKVFGTDGADGLNVSGAVTVGNGVTVTIADGVTITAETTILTAASITGTFALASGLEADYELAQSETTLTITPIDHNIYVDGDVVVGYMDGNKAVINVTTEAVRIPDNATAIEVNINGGNPVLTGSIAMFMTAMSNIRFYADYGASEPFNITAAFPIITAASYVELPNGDYQFTFGLNADGFVIVDSENIYVTPGLRDDGMVCSSVGTPTYSVKTIPGLWYAVKAADNPAMTGAASGTAVQATSATTAVTAREFSGNVKYYKVAVGITAAELAQ